MVVTAHWALGIVVTAKVALMRWEYTDDYLY